MLTALDLGSGEIVEASAVARGPDRVCPLCRRAVILRKGRLVVHHFAHRPEATCEAWRGETQAHLAGKAGLRDAFRAVGLVCEVERPLLSIEGDRRADLIVTGPRGGRVAIEVQHTNIGLEALEARTRAYAAEGLPVIWLPLLDPARLEHPHAIAGLPFNHADRFAPTAWERWIHAYQGGHLWFLSPAECLLWRGYLSPALAFLPPATLKRGEESVPVGGFWRASRRFAELTLEGPFRIADLSFRLFRRPAGRAGPARFPAGPAARLAAQGDDPRAAPKPPCEKRLYRDPRNGETYRRLEQRTEAGWRPLERAAPHPALARCSHIL